MKRLLSMTLPPSTPVSSRRSAAMHSAAPTDIAEPVVVLPTDESSQDSLSHLSGQMDQPSIGSTSAKPSFVPRSESLAFSLRLFEPDVPTRHAPPAPPESPVRHQISNDVKSSPRPPAPTSPPATDREPRAADLELSSPTHDLRWSDATIEPRFDVRAPFFAVEPEDIQQPNSTLALQEPKIPDTPKTLAPSEILLHLGGKDESPAAAVRVIDRGGSINVSVHAPDQDLRASLRSSISELASQLNQQGWRTEVVRATAAASHVETPQNPGREGQGSPNQQHHGQGHSHQERPHQRDRHFNQDQWLKEFEEQNSSNPTNSGGK